jgi:parallel beta helix pectate lyase-like protein
VKCKSAKIKDVEISGFQKSGVILYNSEIIEVNKVYAHDNGFAGILVEGDYKKRMSANIKIVNCRADNNPGDPTNLENHSGNGILVGNCRNVLIEYCTATNNGWDMPRIGNGPVGIWAYEADSVIIQHCIAYRNKTAKGAADGGGFDLDGGVTNSIIQYCLSYENWGSGYGIFQYDGAEKWNNNTVRYCISINDGLVTDHACAMLIWNGSSVDADFTRLYAYNNVFYNEKKYAFAFLDQSRHESFSFFNNVFVASDSSEIFDGIDSSRDDVFLGNVWMRSSGGFQQNGFTDLQKWSTRTGYEQRNGKVSGCSFRERLFSVPSHLDITDPYSMIRSSALLSLCNDMLRNKGIDITKTFSVQHGNTDFFGHLIGPAHSLTPGVCKMK